MSAASSNEVAKSTPIYDEETLAGIRSFDDAMQALSDAGVNVTDITEYGDGFTVCEDKDLLVKQPFVILDYKFAKSDYDSTQEFVILRLVTKGGDKFILPDGGTGIAKQCQDLRRRGVVGGVLCKKGLTKSEYDYVDDSGRRTPAVTYYLSM